MMQLRLQSFSTLVQDMAAAVQGSTTQVLDLTVGSTLRAIPESSASVGLWMQWLILQVLQMTRAATSSGLDLDSWMADFSLTRLAAAPASGIVTFSRFASSNTAVVPIGTLVRTADGSQTFSVVTETTIPGWDPISNGYVLGVGVSTLDVPVVAQTPGSCGNVQGGSVTVLATAIAGIDSVSDNIPFQNGMDAESDSAFRLRFQTYLSSLSRATLGAVANAIASVQQGLSYTIQENQSPSGAHQFGNFVVTVDDGSGYPSAALLTSVRSAVDAVRPIGSTFAVFPPTVTLVDVSLTIALSPTGSLTSTTATLVSAITQYINALPLGSSLPASRIVQLAYAASPDIVLIAGPSFVFKAGRVVIG